MFNFRPLAEAQTSWGGGCWQLGAPCAQLTMTAHVPLGPDPNVPITLAPTLNYQFQGWKCRTARTNPSQKLSFENIRPRQA